MDGDVVILSIGGSQVEIQLPSTFEEFSEAAVKEMAEGIGSGWWLMETTNSEKIFVRLRSIDSIKKTTKVKRKPKKTSKKVEHNHDQQPADIIGDIY